MSQPTEAMEAKTLARRLAVLWGVVFLFGGLCTCISGALMNVKWVELSAQSKFLLFLSVGGNFSIIFGAYISKAAAAAEHGRPMPTNGGGTSFLTKGHEEVTPEQKP